MYSTVREPGRASKASWVSGMAPRGESAQELLHGGRAQPGHAAVGSRHVGESLGQGFQGGRDGAVRPGQQDADLFLQNAGPTLAAAVQLVFPATTAAVDVNGDSAAGAAECAPGRVTAGQNALVAAATADSPDALGREVAVLADNAFGPARRGLVGQVAASAGGVAGRVGHRARAGHR
jgi:hypothetical protein